MNIDEQKQAFKQQGVPARYIDRTLASLGPTGLTVQAYVRSESFEQNVKNEGRGIWLEGEDALCEEAIYLLMKSALIRGIDCVVGTPQMLVEALEDDEHDIFTATAIFIPNFTDPFYETNPLLPHQRYSLEDLLITRMKQNHPMFVHYQPVEGKGWWSQRLMRWLQTNTERFVL